MFLKSVEAMAAIPNGRFSFGYGIRLLKNSQIHLNHYKCIRPFSSTVEPPSPTSNELTVKSSGRAEKISKAMRAYMQRAREHDEFMKREITEFEIGKRHLANIMGVDPDNFTQEDIDKAIAYLLPSGLYDPRARPILKHPIEVFPKKKAAEFDETGRPFHCFFYTGKPNYYQTLYEIALNIKDLLNWEDKMISEGIKSSQSHHQMNLDGSEWLNKLEMEKLLLEELTDEEHDYLIISLNRLVNHPYSDRKKDFILKYRKRLVAATQTMEIPQLMYDEHGRPFMEALGSRKRTNARVIVYGQGKGKFQINDTDIEFFSSLQSREQILFPLIFTKLIGTVDVEATVVGVGFSAQAGAIRLALSTALRSFVSKEMVEKMRLAGLLNWDVRTRERKKPGQEGARRKYTWKKR